MANDSKCTLQFAKLSPFACAPYKGSAQAAGFDLSSAYNCVVPAQGKLLTALDLQIKIPDGCYGRIAPRSSIAFNNFISVGAGVIDADYRGNLKILLFNHSTKDFYIKRGDRIAQLICEKIAFPDLVQVDRDTMDQTLRGSNGFGSTGNC